MYSYCQPRILKRSEGGGGGKEGNGKWERGGRGKDERRVRTVDWFGVKDSNTCRWVQIGRMCGFVLGGRKGLGGGSQGSG